MPINSDYKAEDLISRKRRCRAHVISDLSANYVERFALLNGYTVESVVKDYGYDLTVITFDEEGELENGMIYIQLKATDYPRFIFNGTQIVCSLSNKDLNTWYNELYPIVLTVYDATSEVAYWVYVQQYLRRLPDFHPGTIKESFTIRIPRKNIIDAYAFQKFRKYKSNIINQCKNVVSYQ